MDDKEKINEELKGILELAKDLLSQIEGIKNRADEWESQLENVEKKVVLYDDFFENTNDDGRNQLDELKFQSDSIQTISKVANGWFDEISTFYDKVFGVKKDSKTEIDGYEQIFKKRLEAFEKTIKDVKASGDSLMKELNSLLPGATAVGLASAYHDQKNSYRIQNWGFTIGFVLTLLGMMWVGWCSLDAMDFSDLSKVSFEKTIVLILTRLPFFIPAAWLAIFFGKKLNQSRRLQEEYSFKETFAKSYHGHSEQLSSISVDDEDKFNDLKHRLLSELISITSSNPSNSLESKSHNEDPFFISLVKSVIPAKKEEGSK